MHQKIGTCAQRTMRTAPAKRLECGGGTKWSYRLCPDRKARFFVFKNHKPSVLHYRNSSSGQGKGGSSTSFRHRIPGASRGACFCLLCPLHPLCPFVLLAWAIVVYSLIKSCAIGHSALGGYRASSRIFGSNL